jgi:hypothetical protein
MILAVLLTIAFTLGGALLSYYYDEDAPLTFRLCAGAVTGMVLFGLVGFWLTLVFPFSTLLIVIAGLICLAPVIRLRATAFRARLRRDLGNTRSALGQFLARPRAGQLVGFGLLLFLCYVLWSFFDRAMIVKPEGIFTGVTNNLGDLPFHLSVITGFTEGNNFPPQDPSFAGARFAYPLLADFVAAAFVRLGASWAGAMLLQNLTLAVGLVAILYRYTWKFTRDRLSALIAPFLFLFSGGLGWSLLFRKDMEGGVGLAELLKKLPRDYSIMPDTPYRWGNALTSLLVTQRSLLFGLPLTVLIFLQWWLLVSQQTGPTGQNGEAEAAEDEQQHGKKRKAKHAHKEKAHTAELVAASAASGKWNGALRLLPAGLMAGALPLIHAHSFAVVIAAAGVLAVIFREHWRAWAGFFASALLLAAPQLLWIMHGGSVETQSFLGFHFGWDNGVPDAHGLGQMLGQLLQAGNWVDFSLFWVRNTGLFIPLLLGAIIWMYRTTPANRKRLWFYFPFIFFFIGPNLIKLAPWVWDNIKVLIYWFVASIPLVAGLLGWIWGRSRAARIGVAAAVLVLILAGALDVWRVVSEATEHQVFNPEAVELAAQMREKVPPRSLMLNAPTYNTAVFLTGRRSYLGYTAHVWSHGIDYRPRERILNGIYAGEPGAMELIQRTGVQYVVVGPLERSLAPVNDDFFQQFPVVARVGDSTVYQVAKP